MSCYLGTRPAPGTMFKDRGRSPAEKKPMTPSQKRAAHEENSATHLEYIRALPCCVKGCACQKDVQAHHLQQGVDRSMAMKARDRYTVPLCHEHHLFAVHRFGSTREKEWFRDHGIAEVFALADGLWTMSGNHEKMLAVLMAHWEDEK